MKIFISTGRPVALINNLGAISHLIDGYLTSNGAYCYIGDSVVYDRMISEHDVRALAEASDAGNWMYIVVGIRDLLVRNPDRNVVDTFKKMLNVSDLPTDIPMEEMLRQGIVQMTVFVTAEEERQVMKNTENAYRAVGIRRLPILLLKVPTRDRQWKLSPVVWELTSVKRWHLATVATMCRCCAGLESVWLWVMRLTTCSRKPTM